MPKNTTDRVLRKSRQSLHPTIIEIRKNNDKSYQWWGNDDYRYSPANNDLQTVINYATTGQLARQ